MATELTERQFQQQVVDLARAFGWLAYHTFDSRRSAPGFPDLVLAHPLRGRVIFAELKREKGHVTQQQRGWIDALAHVERRVVLLQQQHVDGLARGGQPRPIVGVRLWRPSDLDAIRTEMV